MILFSPSIIKNYFIFIAFSFIYWFKFAYAYSSIFYFLSFIVGCYPFIVIYYNLNNNNLKWYDPLVIGYLVLFQIFFPSFFLLLSDPIALDIMSFGGSIFDYLDIDDKFIYLFKGQSILSFFSLILLFTNKKKINWRPGFRSRITKGDVFFSRVIVLIVLFNLFNLFKNFKFIIFNLGRIEVEAQSGDGLLAIITRGGLFFLPYALLNLKKDFKFSYYFFFIVIISLLEISGGSRSAVLYFVIFSLFYYGMINDFKFKKRFLILPVSFLLSILIIMSIIRNFNSSSDNMNNSLNSFGSMESTLGQDNNDFSMFIAADRVRPIAMMLRYVEGLNYPYTYGETLIARPLKTINIINRKILDSEIVAYTADEYTHLWRFGTIINKKGNWAVPLSVPGEFYLQFGFLSLLLLSFIFGKIIFYLRNNLINIKSGFYLALNFMMILFLMKSIESELMYYSVVFIFVLPVFIIFYSIIKIKI